MDTIHEQRPDHEMQLFWMEQAGVLAVIQASMEADTATGTTAKAQDCAYDTEGATLEGKEKIQRREKGTVEDCVAVRDTQESASEQESVKDFAVTEKRLWELHRLLKSRKGNLSSTHKKNTDANTQV